MEKIKEVFESNRIPICFSANNSFIPYTAVMIKSIINHASSQNNYDIIILYTDISESNIERVLSLQKRHDNISIRFINIQEYIKETTFFTKSVYTGTVYTNEAYYRLLIPELMPAYDKVLYFDGDMIALSDVAELYYETDMTGYMLASSRDYAGISNCYIPNDPRRDYRANILGLKDINNYILSGMLVFNPAEFNKRYTGKQLMQFCASKDWRQHDQDVLNVICEDCLQIISGSWDYMEDYGNIKFLPNWLQEEYYQTASDIKIVHYAGPRKPWKFNNSFKSDEFWNICYQTPFFKSIFESINKNYGYKNSILFHLFNRKSQITYTEDDAFLSNGEFFIGKMSDIYTQIDSLSYSNGYLEIDGFANLMGIDEDEPVEVYLSVNEKIKLCETTSRLCSEYKFDRLLYRGVPFRGKFKLNPNIRNTLKIVIKIRDNHFVVNKNLRFRPNCAINETKLKYYYSSGCIFTTNCQTITMKPASFKVRLKHERNYQKTIAKKHKLLRMCHFLHRLIQKNQIWLIADRIDKAGDNAEAYFKYLQKNKIKGVKTYFVLDKNSDDYNRVKKLGKIIDINSTLFKFLRVHANKIISSHLDSALIGCNEKVFSDILVKQQRVFLQHGITKDDVSSVYSKYKQKINLFITAAKPEYQSIIDNANYGFTKNEVALTGFARFDLLKNNSDKLISVMPTWRQENGFFNKGHFILNDNFTQTQYYKFYHSLFTDTTLQAALIKYGYQIAFMQHPLFAESNKFFENIPNVNICKAKNYSGIFGQTALLVTDYSSTAFDVAYLKKPIVYCQFDREEFFNTHTYKQGYFDYETNGFGEVCYDIDSTIGTIIDYLKTNCEIKPEYESRIEEFFEYIDKENCNRITSAILGELNLI